MTENQRSLTQMLTDDLNRCSPKVRRRLVMEIRRFDAIMKERPELRVRWEAMSQDIAVNAQARALGEYFKDLDPKVSALVTQFSDAVVRITSGGDVYPWSAMSPAEMAVLMGDNPLSLANTIRDRPNPAHYAYLYTAMFSWLRSERRMLVRVDEESTAEVLRVTASRRQQGKLPIDWRELPTESSKYNLLPVMISWDAEEEDIFSMVISEKRDNSMRLFFYLWQRNREQGNALRGSFVHCLHPWEFKLDEFEALAEEMRDKDLDMKEITPQERILYKPFAFKYLVASFNLLMGLDTYPKYSILEKAKEHHRGKATIGNVRRVQVYDTKPEEVKKWGQYYTNLRDRKK